MKNYYNSDLFYKDINKLLKKYIFINKQIIGKSVLNKDIIAIKVGNGEKYVMFTGTIHANEWITTILLLKFILWYCEKINKKEYIYNDVNLKNIYDNYTIIIVPLLNPDGIDIVNNYLSIELNNKVKDISQQYPSLKYPQDWKANINGVDLNLQFPANWVKAKIIKEKLGYNKPAPKNYVGNNYLSEPESKAIYSYIKENKTNRLFCFHSQGECIYYKYNNNENSESFKIAKKISSESGYLLDETPYESSFAGLKDWFMQEYKRPGFTIEVGKGVNPLHINQINKIFNDNINIILYGIIT